MKIRTFQFNMFSVNTYVVWDPVSLEAAIVDPGMIRKSDYDRIDEFINSEGLTVKYLINTHLHIDHVFGNSHIETTYKIGVTANPADEFLGSRIASQARMFGLADDGLDNISISHRLRDNEKLYLGKEMMEIICVPGHSPGSVAIYIPSCDSVITGDALFQSSIGRTDLPGGSHAALIESIEKRLLTLPDSTIVYPGHGPKTTIGYERQFNPFI